MSIKGSATIELTNADGSKEVIKHDNMITNAVNDMCTSQRGDLATILKVVNNNDSYAQALFGGLLLFDAELNNNADDYFLPTTKVTGYASQDAYAGLDAYRGSFNQAEGGVQEDGSYKFVWDFSTSQANGTIRSLALCSAMMGKIGLTCTPVSDDRGTFEMKRTSIAPFDSNGYMIPDKGTTDEVPNEGIFIIAIIDDIAYAISADNICMRGGSAPASKWIMQNGGKLRLYKYKLGASNIVLSDRVGMANYMGYDDVQLPSDFISTLSTESYKYVLACQFDKNSKKLAVFPCARSNITVNGAIKYCEVDFTNNYQVTTYTYTNNTAGVIETANNASFGPSGHTLKLLVVGGYVLTLSKVGNVYKYYTAKRNDNTQVKEVKYDNGSQLAFSNTQGFVPVFWSERIIIVKHTPYAGTYYQYFAIDLETGEARMTNANTLTEYNNVNMELGGDSVFAYTGSNLRYITAVNPFIIMTKNKLDSPVVKTSSQTMKITYTLTVAESEG